MIRSIREIRCKRFLRWGCQEKSQSGNGNRGGNRTPPDERVSFAAFVGKGLGQRAGNHGIDVGAKGGGHGVSVVGIGLQGAPDDVVEPGVESGAQDAGKFPLAPRRPAGEHLVKHHAHRIQIGAA